jgi:hypothetical protein
MLCIPWVHVGSRDPRELLQESEKGAIGCSETSAWNYLRFFRIPYERRFHYNRGEDRNHAFLLCAAMLPSARGKSHRRDPRTHHLVHESLQFNVTRNTKYNGKKKAGTRLVLFLELSPKIRDVWPSLTGLLLPHAMAVTNHFQNHR